MKISRNITKYISYAIVMILLALSSRGESISIASSGMYIALCFAKENVYILSIIYMLTTIIVMPSLSGLIVAVVPAFVMCIAHMLLEWHRKRMSIYLATIISTIAYLPLLIIDIVMNGHLIRGILTIGGMTIFTYLCIIAVFALIVKKLRYKLAIDEIISYLTILAMMSAGLYSIDIYGFRIYYVVMTVGILLMSSIFSIMPTMIMWIAFGIGGGIFSQNLELAGIISLLCLVCYVFVKYNKYFMVVSFIAVDMLGGIYFSAYREYTLMHIIAVLIGCIIYLIIPRKKLVYLKNAYGDSNKSTAITTFINRNRIDVNAKINNLAGLFSDIEAEMTRGEYILTEKSWKEATSQRIMCEVCAHCPNKDMCFEALGGDTISQIAPIVEMARQNRADTKDASNFLLSRCSHIVDMVNLANSYAEKYIKNGIHICNVLDNKKILGEEIGSIGRVLTTLSNGIFEGVTQNSDLESRIIEELNLLGIICHDVLVVQNKSGDIELTLVIRDKDKNKRCIMQLLEKLTHLRLERFEDRVCEIEGFSTIRYVPSSKYTLSYGISSIKMEGSSASGDSKSIIRLGNHKVAIILCDGKGSGELAMSNSANTIGIIEKMYKAGFDAHTILSFANRLLSIRNSEDFSAIDMCVIDLDTGECDFIKLGGVTSYIKRPNSVDKVEGSALPLGVLDEATPSVMRRVISCSDIVLIVSDGVTDSIGSDIEELLLDSGTSNVQTIADSVCSQSSLNGAIDDTTCIAFKINKV